MLKQAFKEDALSQSRTFEWFARFKAGRTSVKDDLHTGRPLSLRNPENELKIKPSNARRTTMTIENLYDKLESYLLSLYSLGVTQDQNATFLYPMVESSLPEELIQFLRQEVKGEERLNYVRAGFGESSKRVTKPYTTRLHGTEVRDTEDPEHQGESFKGRTARGINRGMHVKTLVPRALLATALVRLVNHRNEEIVVRALLDQGSQFSILHKNVLQILNIPVSRVNAQIYGVNSIKGEEVRELAHFVIKPLGKEKWELPLQALLVDKMTGLLPGRGLCLPLTEELRSAQLADPQFEKSGKVDLILGADVYGSILLPEIRRCKKTQLCAQNTRLGWILSGELTGGNILGTTQVFSTHVQYEDNMEPLPFDPKLTETIVWRVVCHLCQRQIALERRLEKDEILRQEYRFFMGEYAELGHMTSLSEQSAKDEKGCCFIPHLAVRKNQPNRDNIRVVFNASTKTLNGLSFNERLYTGPKLQTDIFTILIKWRQYKVVVLTDIEKMYRQILVRPQDAENQSIFYLWNFPCSFPGTPNLIAIGTGQWKQISESSGGNKKRDISVDDIITGAETSMKTLNLRDELIGLLKGGGFVLKKWTSNDPAILKDITEESRLQLIMFEDTEVVKTLGVGWNPKEDCFVYNLQCTSATEEFTKRQMLSFVAKLYDPVGWLAPVIIVGKTMIQQLWVTGAKWDEPKEFTIRDLWRKFRDELKYLRSMRIPRCLGLEGMQEIQLHGFCDASEDAYAAAVYLKVPNYDNQVTLLAAKTRLTPMQRISIPKLDLCAAVLLTRLIARVLPVLDIDIKSIVCWTDSTIALNWIKPLSRALLAFIGNQMAEIQACRQIQEWRYVPTGDNPADIASRGILGSQLNGSTMRWNGPTWLA
ncbi:hypothetical protein LAZ67_15000995 [Cordylochernes scorpioides]|uniref:Peptidase aspartic putative domain-containing protein n=1 Tax=Cordylochernes scorpioides TaxID=51811 RepID=A0ABY6LBY1_9ARAC|nr:hypothetical protein LAZ67_15000995 [Cordylochernes scorpioides]